MGYNLQRLLDRLCRPTEQQPSRQTRRRQQRATQQAAVSLWAKTHGQRRGLLVALILYTFACNAFYALASVDAKRNYASLVQPAALLGLNQTWRMFYYPPALCANIALVGRLRDGSHIDLLRAGAPVTDRKQSPTQQLRHLPTRLWSALLTISNAGNKLFREDLLKHFAHSWNRHATSKEEEIVESFLTFYPQQHHPMAAIKSQDLFHLDLQAQGVLVAGERHGPWVLYHDNGQQMSVGNYQRGKAAGNWTFWDPAGKKIAEGIMHSGKPAGEWKHYEGDTMKIVNHSQSTQRPEKREPSP